MLLYTIKIVFSVEVLKFIIRSTTYLDFSILIFFRVPILLQYLISLLDIVIKISPFNKKWLWY